MAKQYYSSSKPNTGARFLKSSSVRVRAGIPNKYKYVDTGQSRLKSSSVRVRSVSSVQVVSSVRSGGLSSGYYSSNTVGSYSPILAILLMILVVMLFFTTIKYFYTGSDRVYLFTDMLNFFGNIGSLNFVIPTISSVSTGITIIDTLLNTFILGINCLTFIFSSLINLIRFAFYVIQFIFFY